MIKESADSRVYGRASLSSYSFRERLLIRLADLAFFILIALIGSTLRFSITGSRNAADAVNSGRFVLALWHDRIFAGTYFLRNRGLVVLTSQSFDGEYIARFLTRFGFGTVRGSSTRGGVRGLVEMIRLMRSGLPMAFTVDGPKGPRYQAKSGPAMLAAKTGCPIVPFSVECCRFFRIKSWDRLQIPIPFSHSRVFLGEPIHVAPDSNANSEVVEKGTGQLQVALDDLVEQGRKWRESIQGVRRSAGTQE